MAFCSKGMQAAKNILHNLTIELEKIIDATLTFTGKLIALTGTPGVSELLALIPGEAAVQAAMVKGIDILTNIDEVLKETDPAKKLSLFMADLKKYDPQREHGFLIKLASIMTSIIHGQQHPESTYDSLTQLKAVVIKHDE